MKKLMRFLMMAILIAVVFTACKKDDDEGEPVVEASLIKTIEFYADWAGGTEKWEFTYDANKKVTGFDNYWDNVLDKEIVYDYTTNGMLILEYANGDPYNEYEINAQGYITKEDWGGGEYASYE